MIMYLAINMMTIIETMVMIAMRSPREKVIKRLKLSAIILVLVVVISTDRREWRNLRLILQEISRFRFASLVMTRGVVI